jgi:hypothetical protein
LADATGCSSAPPAKSSATTQSGICDGPGLYSAPVGWVEGLDSEGGAE